MDINDFDYELPRELIAQRPAEKREECRLLAVDRTTGAVSHRRFYDVIDYLRPGDCLVMNDSRVIPARLFGVKEGTGAKIEFLLIKRKDGDVWETMVRPGRRLREGDVVSFSDDFLFRAEIVGHGDDGTRYARFEYDGIFLERLEEIGRMPLPPYIERESTDEDREMYQTVYSRVEGSVAAPTAGLHFTNELLDTIRLKGVNTAYVTLHVGIGTFRPVKALRVEDHHMHFEEYSVPQEAADLINSTREAGGRIICVGTTSVRTIESASERGDDGVLRVKAGSGSTDIFIYPGYEFKMTDALITNFHLPKSTLLMLISALYDREKIISVYEEAIKERYRFFSYGDAMIII